MNFQRRSCLRIGRSLVWCIGSALLLVGAVSCTASFGFPNYSQRASIAFQGTASQFEGSQIPSTQGSGGAGDPSGWSTDGNILTIANAATVSETWFAVPGFTSNPSNGYTLEMRFKVTNL